MSSSRKKFYGKALAGLFAASAVMTAGVVLSAPAQAVTDTCKTDYVCAYENANFGGHKIMMKVGCWNFGKCGFSRNFNDMTTSIRNDSGQTFCFWTDEGYHGGKFVMPPHTFISNVGVGLNDSFTSGHMRGTGGAGC